MRLTRVLLLSTPLLALPGCGPSQTEARTGQGPDYSKYVFALYDEPGAGGTASLQLSFPMKLAVAEVGQLQPSPKLLDELKAQTRLFSRVESITGISNGDSYTNPYSVPAGSGCGEPARPVTDEPRLAMRRLQRLARDTGADYLLIAGATVDTQASATPLSGLTLTVVGSFIAPSQRLTAQGQASAALIDLRGDRIVMTSSSSADNATVSPLVAQEGVQTQQVRTLRDTVYGGLGRQFVADCQRRAGITSTNRESQTVPTLTQGGKS